MLKVPSRRPVKPFGMDVTLTVSRRSEGGVEVAVSSPGQSKATQPERPAAPTGRRDAAPRPRKMKRG